MGDQIRKPGGVREPRLRFTSQSAWWRTRIRKVAGQARERLAHLREEWPDPADFTDVVAAATTIFYGAATVVWTVQIGEEEGRDYTDRLLDHLCSVCAICWRVVLEKCEWGGSLESVIEETLSEIDRACRAHPGWPDNPIHGAAIIAEEADAIGVSITTSAIDFGALVDQLVSTYDWELILIGLSQSLDPVPSADNFFPSSANLHMTEPNQSSPRWPWEQTIDDAWEAAATTTDIAARKAEYQTIQQTWIGAAPIIYTATRTDYLGAPATLGNVDTAYLHPFPGFGWEALIARIYVK